MKKNIACLAGTVLVLFCLVLGNKQALAVLQDCLNVKFIVLMAFMVIVFGGIIGGAYGATERTLKIFLIILLTSFGAIGFLALNLKPNYNGAVATFLAVRSLLCMIAQYIGWLIATLAGLHDKKQMRPA